MGEIRKIARLLVANRGEIALRVMRTARQEGIATVAVFSEADARSPHVKYADEAVCIGAPPVAESYLKGDRVIEAALDKGADAIHPGYGLLSENAAFAEAVARAGLIFVGPPPQAIEIMGDKARAKRRMIEAGVPCVPGYEGEDQDPEVLTGHAAKIGYPVMVKAAAGGGGRGMRLVTAPGDLPDALSLARSEAESAFGSGTLILEKAIVRPRHVEIQIIADDHGNVIHLGERDCSVQRRHQKVVEESPCPVMTPDLRAAMGAAAVEAARAVDYRGAGTVEFLLDESGAFYFLEMNTRLQVEHPVTELVTGLDLVALQLAVAEGRPLGIEQEAVRFEGHAIEVRLCAEDPAEDFLPSTGPVHHFSAPRGVRTDAGIESGGEVSPFYDSMVAKVIAHGTNRDEARRKLIQGLGHTACFGPATNRDFLIDVLQAAGFADGGATTAFIEETYGEQGWTPEAASPLELASVAVIEHVLGRRAALEEAPVSDELLDWSSARDLETVLRYEIDGDPHFLAVRPRQRDVYDVQVDGGVLNVAVEIMEGNEGQLTVDGHAVAVDFWRHSSGRLFVALPERTMSVMEVSAMAGEEAAGGGDGLVDAPMHGQLLEILVAEGDRVSKGDRLAVLEAMKMQHELRAEVDGVVIRIAAEAGQQIAADTRILEIEPEEG